MPVFNGTAGGDLLVGTTSPDSFVGGSGNDTIDGGAGSDVVLFPDATTGVVVDLLAGTASDGQGGLDTLVFIEGVDATAFNDTVRLSNSAGS